MSEGNSNRLATKANELYWETSRPAGRLADELGISRSKFYALIEPLELATECEECGAPLSFNSRTDREAGRGRCANCGAVADVEPEALEQPEVSSAALSEEDVDALPAARTDAPIGTRALWLTAVAGAAAGMALTAWWRRR